MRSRVGVLIACVALLLTGCSTESGAAPTDTTPTPPPVDSAPATPSVSPSPSASVDDTLFTVTAKVRATDGSTVDLELVAHRPVDSTADEASALADDFIEQCSAMGGTSVSEAGLPISLESLRTYGSSLLRLDFTSTPADQTFLAPVDLALGSEFAAKVASGDGVVAVATNVTCTGRYQLASSGTATAIIDYESGIIAPDDTKWGYGRYGFALAYESGATIESCGAVVDGQAVATVRDIPGWTQGADATPISCGIGFIGE